MQIAERTATWRRERRVLFRGVAGGMAAGARLEQAGRERSWAFLIALVAGLIWGPLSGFGVLATVYFHRFWALGLLGYVLYRTVWPVSAYPFNIPGYVSIGWVVPGFGLVAWVSRRSPEALGRSGLVFTTSGEGG